MILTYILAILGLVSSQDFLSSKSTFGEVVLRSSYSEKVIKAGFEFEEHKITTADGYINTAWRIPRRLGEDPKIKHKPIIMQHGLLDDSWTWFALNATDCLGIMLAQQGYDVWFTNSRGNMFSYEHKNPEYDSKQFYSKYWNFTFVDMAKYDFPAHVSFVKEETGFDKIYYIGHSQGTFQYFINYMIDPSFIEKHIEKFVSIGTVFSIASSVRINLILAIACSGIYESHKYY
jgi:pimeloyl-ACP methyl ester carboxylesterase